MFLFYILNWFSGESNIPIFKNNNMILGEILYCFNKDSTSETVIPSEISTKKSYKYWSKDI